MVKRNRILELILLALGVLVLSSYGQAADRSDPYTTYIDPKGRFSFDYPSTMTVHTRGPNEVTISHPKATLRISVYVDRRPPGKSADVAPLLAAFKLRLKQEMKQASIVEEGHLPGPKKAQGYVICAFTDARGVKYVQLVHYYVTKDRLLQMIISDRPQGFRNLAKVIRTIHRSLKILKPESL